MPDTFASQRSKRETKLVRKDQPRKPQVGDTRPALSYTESGRRKAAQERFAEKNQRRKDHARDGSAREMREARMLRSKFGGAFGRSKDTKLAMLCALGTSALDTYTHRHRTETERKRNELATMLDGAVVTEETLAGGGTVQVKRQPKRDKVRSKRGKEAADRKRKAQES